MEFIAEDEKSKKIKKLAFMLKELDVNVYIYGEFGTGKTFLANFIANQNDLIIENFDELKEFIKTDKRIIGVGKSALNENVKEKYDITVEIFLDSLDKRKKDIEAFKKYFIKEVKEHLKIKEDVEVEIDISENLNSLKKSIYKSFLKDKITKDNLIECIEKFFSKNEMSYDEALKIFDKGLFQAFKTKYPSKLQMAKALKINRGTLSKKWSSCEI
jgi:transcriptional regulator with PAS, ATPase and Fis domain